MAQRSRSGTRQDRHAAEALAVAALGFIAGEPERLGRFLAMTGIGPDSIRAAGREPRACVVPARASCGGGRAGWSLRVAMPGPAPPPPRAPAGEPQFLLGVL